MSLPHREVVQYLLNLAELLNFFLELECFLIKDWSYMLEGAVCVHTRLWMLMAHHCVKAIWLVPATTSCQTLQPLGSLQRSLLNVLVRNIQIIARRQTLTKTAGTGPQVLQSFRKWWKQVKPRTACRLSWILDHFGSFRHLRFIWIRSWFV